MITNDRESLKEKILKLALKEISKNGVEGLSLRELAKELKVSHAAPYRHFATKNALVEALAKEGYEKLFFLMEKSILHIQDPREKLYQLGYAYVQFSIENPEYFTLMYSVNESKNSQESFSENTFSVYNFLKNVIEENIKSGSYKDENLDTLTFAAWAYLHGLALLWNKQKIEKNPSILSEALKTYMELFEKGLAVL